MPSVLILGARSPAALDHARRFAHQGWTVIAADSIPCRITGSSRAVAATVRLSPPRTSPLAFADDLRRACDAHAVDVVLPTCEEVFYLSRYRDRLPSRVHAVVDDFATLRDVHGKWRFVQLARDCGAHVPASARVATLDEARDWAGERPVVLKPEYSRFGVHVRVYRDGIPRVAAPLAALGHWVVQAFVDGDEHCSYSVADRGRVVAHSLYRPRWRLAGSSGFWFEPAEDATIRTFVERFAAKLGFQGQLSFDWIRRADGTVAVLECNPRATSGCHLFSADDALPAALAGTGDERVEPSDPRPRMIGPVMATAGLSRALRDGTIAAWRRDMRAATDVIAVPGDRGPLRGALRDLGSYARLALAQRCNLREAATRDIEWDGEELPA